MNKYTKWGFRCPKCGGTRAQVCISCDCVYDTVSIVKINSANDDSQLMFDGELIIGGDASTQHFACHQCGELVRDASGKVIDDELAFAHWCKLHGTCEEDE